MDVFKVKVLGLTGQAAKAWKRAAIAHVYCVDGAIATRRRLRQAVPQMSAAQAMQFVIDMQRDYSLFEWKVTTLAALASRQAPLARYRSDLRNNVDLCRDALARINGVPSLRDADAMINRVTAHFRDKVHGYVWNRMRFLVRPGVSIEDMEIELITQAAVKLRWYYPFMTNPMGVFWAAIGRAGINTVNRMRSEKHDVFTETVIGHAEPVEIVADHAALDSLTNEHALGYYVS